ncbi:MAG TPA: hybrid sensor histidine kinase/response regulator [Verrucomicrobiae bacterium]|nr:hybrid sensor histidine kinase/response regulator [Verrucomicrobiae bacterium]
MTGEPGAMDSHDTEAREAALLEVRARLEELVAAHRRVVLRERVSAFREMAGEMAHDFNDTLSGLLARAQILLTNAQDPLMRRSLRMIEQVVLDGASTVRRLQDFSRIRPARPFEPVDFNQLVSEIAAAVRTRWNERLAPRNISGEVHAETAPLPLVAGDAAELRHVLATIGDNAADAMPDGGTLTFRTGTDGQRVCCHVADTGVGMSDEVRQRIFDPFFTTKGEKGPDFGLAGAFAIVDRHGGEITVESETGKGSTFTIWLPLAPASMERAPEPNVTAPVAAARPSTSGAQILLIADAEEVREVLRDLLTRHGHSVVARADGNSGLAELGTWRFDLAMVDLSLPGVSGLEVAQQLKLRTPGTTVALMTGYFDRMRPDDVRAKGVDVILKKPFSLDQVQAIVDKIARERPSPSDPDGT